MTDRETQEMDQYFDLQNQRAIRSLYVNHRLLHMSQQQLHEVCQTYGLSPVEQYLDVATLQMEQGEQQIKGFLRYLDAYLTEESAGKRTELRRLGESLLGRKLIGQNARTLRLELMQGILVKLTTS